MKTTAIFYPNKVKRNQRTAKIPLYLRICFKGAKSEFRLNAEISDNDLLRWDPITMRLQERNSPINHYLNRIEQKFQEFTILNATNILDHTAASIKNHLFGTSSKGKISLMQFVDDYFEKAVLHNVNKRPGTIKNYRRAINHLKSFLGHSKKQSMLLQELNYEFASDFKNYLVTTDQAKGRIGMNEVSAATVIKKFRTIFSEAVEHELIKKNPFKIVKIKTKSPRKERLTIYQLSQIYKLDLTEHPYLQLPRDIMLFCIFTGLAYLDSMSLTWSNLEERNSDTFKLNISRQKSEIMTEAFLTTYAITIVKKYRAFYKKDPQKILPYRSKKELNLQYKKIGNLANIPFELTTHTCRHTFRQLLAEAGVTDYGVIKRMMGQSRNGDVDEVYYSITESALIDAKNKLEQLFQTIF